MDLPHILVKDVVQCFKSIDIAPSKMFETFVKCVTSFGFSENDNIVPLYYMIINDPCKFKDPNNYPKTWKSDSIQKAGVSAINRSLELSVVRNVIGNEAFNILSKAFDKYIHDEEEECHVSEIYDIEYTDTIKRAKEHNASLVEKNKILETKLNTLLEIINILTIDSPTHKALVNVTLETLDMF